MAGHGRDMAYTAGEITGQAQMKKDDFFNQASDASHDALNTFDNTHSAQNPTITTQATNFLHQTGEQVKNMAQGAAEAVKSTLGMNADNNPNSPNRANTTNFNTSSTNNPNATNFNTSSTNNPNATNFNTSSTNHPSHPTNRRNI